MSKEASISQVVYDAGQKLIASTGNLTDVLNQTLNQLLTCPFQAITGFVKDIEGKKTDIFSTIIHVTSKSQSTSEQTDFNSDNVACVIDVSDSLNIDKLRAAYERIACAKRLKKTPPPDGHSIPFTTVTLGIIFTQDSIVPIELLAEELNHLNIQHPDHEWTDMVVVLSKGIINYAVQFPGENIIGDFLPPAEGALINGSPPMYIILVVSSSEQFGFNKMYSFLIAHLTIFFPDAQLPKWNQILNDTTKRVMTITGYQYNLSGKLMPVLRQFYTDRFIPPRPFLIEDQKGILLSTIQFLPWQDGGVVLLKGKLPLEGLLIFLGQKTPNRKIRRDDVQISYVLPITQENFLLMIERLQRQSNMVIKLDPSKFVFQKIMDEGTKSPFVARIYLGILQLRDIVFLDNAKRNIFDKTYELVIDALLNTRSASQIIFKLINDHFNKLVQGKIGQLRGQTIYIEESIDNELCKEVETFLNNAVRTLKQGMQKLIMVMGKDIGFLFKKQIQFEKGIKILEKNDLYLTTYLIETRKWSERLLDRRNAMEHEGWKLPKIQYTAVSGIIYAKEPEILSQKISDFIKLIMDRLICFVEEITVHCLITQMPTGITVTEIPLPQRKSDIPLRFKPTLTNGGMPIWSLKYHQSLFEET